MEGIITVGKSRLKKLFNLIRPCQGAADENLAKFSSVGLKVNTKLRYSNPLTHPRKNPAGFSSALPWQGGMVLLAILATSLFSTTPTSAVTCDPNNIHAPACISMSIETIVGNCPDKDTNNVCVDIPSGGGIAIGGQKLSIISNDRWTEISLSLTASNAANALINSQSDDKIYSMGFDEGLLSQENPIITNTLGDKQWGIALYKLIDLSRSNSNNNVYSELGFDDKTTYLSSNQGDLRGARFVGVELFNYGPIYYGYPDVRDYYHPDFTVFYGARVDDPLSLKAGEYSTGITYTATRELRTPSIDSVSPSSYELGSSNESMVKVGGSDLSSVYQAWIDFDDKNGEMEDNEICTIDYDTSTWNGFSCTIPTSSSITPGTYDFYVTTQGGTTKLENGFTYTYNPYNTSTDGNITVEWDKHMIPIKWDSNNKVVTVSKEDITTDPHNWYNYNETNKQWADAITVSNPDNYTDKPTGTPVVDSDILGYWVYIPRYRYQVMRKDATDAVVQAKNFTVEFQTTNEQPDIPTCSNPNADESNSSTIKDCAWATHPAFTWGDKQLNGFWMGKFETTGSLGSPTILPNDNPMHNVSIGDLFDTAKSIGAYSEVLEKYGNGGTDFGRHNLMGAKTRMIKNDEWGAAAYLSASKYGAGVGNVQINGYYSDHDKAISLTGCGPQADKNEWMYNTTCQSYQTELGLKASSTNNIYGVYDMSGGMWEYAMGNRNSAVGVADGSEYLSNPVKLPYVNLYPTISANGKFGVEPAGSASSYEYYYNFGNCTWTTCGGHALHETLAVQSVSQNLQAWTGDYSRFVSDEGEWFIRGGDFDDGGGSGVSAAAKEYGQPQLFTGLRVTMTNRID